MSLLQKKVSFLASQAWMPALYIAPGTEDPDLGSIVLAACMLSHPH